MSGGDGTPAPTPKLRALVGPSQRLRDGSLAGLIGAWDGQVRRASDPADLRGILADIDTPGLFGGTTLWVVRASEAWIRQHAATLAPLAGTPAAAGALLLSAATIDGRTPLAKALAASGHLLEARPPWDGLRWGEAAAACHLWISERLAAHRGGVQRAHTVAERLHAHCGEDADALLAAIDVLCAYAGDEALTPEAVDAVVVGTPERPAWEFSAAVLAGDAAKALGVLHAGTGMEPGMALAVLHNEVRKQLACLAAPEDGAAAALAGLKGRPNLRPARRQAESLGAERLRRLLTGILRAQRQLRGAARDPALAIEMLVLHARLLVAPVRR